MSDNLENIFGFFDKLVTSFTWSRFTFTVAVILMLVGTLVCYEIYTNHFRLSRLEAQVKILQQLVDVSDKVHVADKDKLLDEAFTNVITSYNQQFSIYTYRFTVSLPKSTVRALYTLLPWFILGVLCYASMDTGRKQAVVGIIAMAILFMLIGGFIPESSASWVANWLYPWGSFAVALALIIIWDKGNKRRALALG